MNIAAGMELGPAYKDAGFRSASPSNALVLKKKPKVAERISELLKDLRDDIKIEGAELVRDIKDILSVDITEVITWDKGKLKLKASADLSPQARKAISEIKQNKDGTISVKLYGKDKFIELAGRSIGFFTDNVKHDVGPTLADLICESNEKKKDEDGQNEK